MLHQVIQTSGADAVDAISDSCSEVTLGCSDVSGLVQEVLASSEKLRAEHTALLGTVATLNEDQDQVAQACEESRLLSQRSLEQLAQGTNHIRSSLAEIGKLLVLVDTLTQHVTGFAAAIGGGLDIRLTPRIDLRAIQIDYNPMRFDFSDFGAVGIPGTPTPLGEPRRTLHNFRIGIGIVIRN